MARTALCKHEGCDLIGRRYTGYCDKHHHRFVRHGDSSIVGKRGTPKGQPPAGPPNEGVGPEAVAAYRRAYLSGELLEMFNRRLRRDMGETE